MPVKSPFGRVHGDVFALAADLARLRVLDDLDAFGLEVFQHDGSHFGSSLPNAFAPSITVTLHPSRTCACAISMPMGPPPMTIRCSGCSRRSKMSSLV